MIRAFILSHWPHLLIALTLCFAWQVVSAYRWQTRMINRRNGR